jgi:FAD/FMN-containing dehydrogenase
MHDALSALVGADHVLTADDLRAGYETDWTRRFTGRCDAVVRPGTTAEVAAVLAWCYAHGVPVTTQGGNTGLVGGGVPDGGGIVLSTRRLRALGPLDPTSGQITAQAGVTLAALEAATAGTRWEPGVDLGARDTATIGGMVATNAGGTRVLRHGMMRRNVVGVEAVLADGTVLSHLAGLEKDNTGYDLAGLLTGSEGTLAVVTAARLRLVPRQPEQAAAWVACGSWDDATELSTALRLDVAGLEGLEAADARCLHLVEQALGLPALFAEAPTVAVLAAWAGRGDPPAELAAVIGSRPHVVAIDPTGVRRLWAHRERITEALATRGIPHKLDVTVPLAGLHSFVDDVHRELDGLDVHLFGHLGDGNLHVNVLGAAPDDTTVDGRVLALVASHGGSISAEHGIGRAKRRWLHLSRSEAEIAAFRRVKRALDPRGILNPGVLLDSTDDATPDAVEGEADR